MCLSRSRLINELVRQKLAPIEFSFLYIFVQKTTTEMDRPSKRKRAHNCPKACPCTFSQDLIGMFHNARKVAKDAEKLSKRANNCKFRMTKSEIDFFKKDMKMCNVMIAETRGRRAEMRELMDMWQEANEKMIIRKKDIKSIIDGVRENKRNNEWRITRKWSISERMRIGFFTDRIDNETHERSWKFAHWLVARRENGTIEKNSESFRKRRRRKNRNARG